MPDSISDGTVASAHFAGRPLVLAVLEKKGVLQEQRLSIGGHRPMFSQAELDVLQMPTVTGSKQL